LVYEAQVEDQRAGPDALLVAEGGEVAEREVGGDREAEELRGERDEAPRHAPLRVAGVGTLAREATHGVRPHATVPLLGERNQLDEVEQAANRLIGDRPKRGHADSGGRPGHRGRVLRQQQGRPKLSASTPERVRDRRFCVRGRRQRAVSQRARSRGSEKEQEYDSETLQMHPRKLLLPASTPGVRRLYSTAQGRRWPIGQLLLF